MGEAMSAESLSGKPAYGAMEPVRNLDWPLGHSLQLRSFHVPFGETNRQLMSQPFAHPGLPHR